MLRSDKSAGNPSVQEWIDAILRMQTEHKQAREKKVFFVETKTSLFFCREKKLVLCVIRLIWPLFPRSTHSPSPRSRDEALLWKVKKEGDDLFERKYVMTASCLRM